MTQRCINDEIITVTKIVSFPPPFYPISKWFSEQPDLFLLELARTPHQQKYYRQLCIKYGLLAIAWQSRMIQELDDPIDLLYRQKCITRDARELTWLLCDVFSQIWELLRHCFKRFRSSLKKFNGKCPFKTASQVFCEIIREKATYEFLECQQPYYKFSTHKVRHGISQLSAHTAEDFATTNFFLQICHESKREIVKSHLEQLQATQKYYDKYWEKAVLYRGFSYEWHDGILKKGNKGGYYN